MDVLPTLWFVVIAVLWTGYLLLEGFDLGVGIHMLVSARGEKERRLMLNTIGPVWDGNEVWLLTAGGATFAAFPYWYASLFSGLYVPLVLVLVALICRAVAIEYRGKHHSLRWGRAWDVALGLGSFVAAFGVGAMLAITTTGLPIDANGDRVGGPFAWLSWQAVIGGLAVVGFCLAHAAAFLGLKTEGAMSTRMRRFFRRGAIPLLIPIVVWVVTVQLADGNPVSWCLVAVAALGSVVGIVGSRRGSDGVGFLGMAVFLVAGVAAIFTAVYPVVLPSSLDPANSLTVSNASSGDYTLGVMTVVAAFGVPLVLASQAWTYWVFRRRLAVHHIPDAHPVVAAVRR
ncbi:cytochrome d ubiquinol oxidase subunit II [Schumannella luteola]|uniref:Cytochrome d ubiquinol oxidase subunit II n=1 Tax=Schumannella luteola TaxID=472059 RepID=A0A852YL22_9MICO|nr:cytochrome d ubiquinol oxidase subunit II [Schumannella luteola]NYG99898.1 cytochrome d ubiquinol oxidase subunit II [Schumannella luteola]TPX02175.1 cytochrome d ubiquinol oxidase subunit II [Schumannella luteola]